MSDHLHEWESLGTERQGNKRIVRHVCMICADIMTTTLTFGQERLESVEVAFEPLDSASSGDANVTQEDAVSSSL